ncbi:MAG: cytochrome-c peroxidase [Saprospiraceae bacterium]
MNKLLQAVILFVILFFSCTQDKIGNPLDYEIKGALDRLSKTNNYDYYIFPESDDVLSLPNQDPKNPVTLDKVKLGQLLFHETGLAQGASQEISLETYSCSSCHIASAGFTPGRMQGIADGGLGYGEERELWESYDENEIDAQGLRPLTILNVGYMENTLWSGIFGAYGVNEGTEHLWGNDPLSEVNHLGLAALESQNIEGLSLHRLEITDKVLDEYGYREYFDKCFPEFPIEERYSVITASFALGAYLRNVLANEAPLQKYLKGDNTALSEMQKRGALLFLGKARCSTCHNSPSFGNIEFYALGTKDLYHQGEALNTDESDARNLGRGFFTGEEIDNYAFKVPQLYNIGDYTHFFHGSSKTTLREVIEFKIKAKSENSKVADENLSPYFRELYLTDDEVNELLDFLENGLRDPNLERYVPEEVLSGNCFPNNDPFSIFQTGCN